MAHELLHFALEDGKYSIVGHDIEEFYLIADRFGLRWDLPTHGDVSDILSPDFEWGKVGQKQLDLSSVAADLVGAFGLEGAKNVVAAAKEVKAQMGDAAADNPTIFAQQVQDHVAGLGAKVIDLGARRTGTAE
jgi:hypothetical protein